MFPEGNVNAAGSYCRDPDGARGKPWCFTVNPNVEWQFCDVPNCTGRQFAHKKQ
ncbi:hypothetical protein DPMN_111356 [Dreissena polymorpha]|uniref:Kringle domain-containing protein n=1 Tax=Dreissena polymorpha TaxID=45954 RepID=A0A9D4KDP7_DREPO|nr:hypothetical protein DPMN_111356 [Dreissena polymorpha]